MWDSGAELICMLAPTMKVVLRILAADALNLLDGRFQLKAPA
jgi:hypothetical protein